MYQPYFSRGAVQKLETTIRENLSKFLSHLSEAAKSSETKDLTLGYKCLVADSIMQYCYDKPFDAIDSVDFALPMIVDLEGYFDSLSIGWYFPQIMNNLFRIVERLPRSFAQAQKPLAATLEIQDVGDFYTIMIQSCY